MHSVTILKLFRQATTTAELMCNKIVDITCNKARVKIAHCFFAKLEKPPICRMPSRRTKIFTEPVKVVSTNIKDAIIQPGCFAAD